MFDFKWYRNASGIEKEPLYFQDNARDKAAAGFSKFSHAANNQFCMEVASDANDTA